MGCWGKEKDFSCEMAEELRKKRGERLEEEAGSGYILGVGSEDR